MKLRSAVLFGAATACQPAGPGLPWLHGLDGVVSSTGEAGTAPAIDDLALDCGVAASRTIELVADVAPTAGRETIVASYGGGLAVYDRERQLVAEAPGYRCEGSADELVAIAAGTAFGDPLLAVAATSGGHQEAMTWVTLYATGRTLEPVFAGAVEARAGDRVERGAIYLLPGGLMMQQPAGTFRFWRLDPGARIYIPVLPVISHDEPPPLISSR